MGVIHCDAFPLVWFNHFVTVPITIAWVVIEAGTRVSWDLGRFGTRV
jgi:hypothetical protein